MALAKTTRPTVTGSVTRPRLFRWLDRARKVPVTWVWAPPGAGKTILVASYVVGRKLSSCWYQIDDGDNDLATFFYFLGLAAPKRRRPLPLFTPEYRQGLSTFTRNFFRELYGRLKTPFVLVFDNYQEVPVDSELHDVMRDGVLELPQGGRAIFISRSELPASFARLRADQAVEILDWPELRFTEAEMGELARKLAPRRKESISQLYKSVEGWAAGLVLLLEHQGNGHASSNQGKQSSEVLFDYFAGEIFKKFSPETKEVLLQTAFLPQVTTSMAEKLTGQPTAGQVLGDLHRQNYFTNRRMADELIYEYHPLFREFLLSQGEKEYTVERRAEIRGGAANLAEAAGQIEAAVELFRDAGDWEGLARLSCRNAPTLLSQGRVQTLEAWLRMLPPQIFDQVPWLLYWRGVCGLGWRHEECRCDLEQGLLLFRRQRDTAGIFLAWSSIVISYIFETYSQPLDPWIALLDDLVEEAQGFPSKEVEAQVATSMLAAITWRQPGHPDGHYWAERAFKLARQHPDLGLRTSMAIGWVFYHWQRGDLEKNLIVVEDMRDLMRAANVSPFVVLSAGNIVAACEWMCGSLSCCDTVAQLLEFAKKTGVIHSVNYCILRSGIIAALDQGDLTTAATWLPEMEKDLPRLGTNYRCWYHSCVIRDALIRQDIEKAAAHQPEMLRLGLDSGWPLDEVFARVLSAHVKQARGNDTAARDHVERALEIARTMRSPFAEFMARLTQAHVCFANGEQSAGLDALQIAMALGKAGGFVNTEIWIPAVMARLCAKALEAGIEVEYVQMLVRKRKLVPEEPPVDIEAWPWPVKIYTLGRFVVLKDDEPLGFTRKVQRKPLALLKAVIAFGGRGVREEALIDSLWPDAEGDAAHFALTSAIHRLRRLLGHEEAIIRKDNELSVNNRYCWVDVWAFERLLTRADGVLLNSDHNGQGWAEYIRFVHRAAELYQGSFLGGDAEAPWATTVSDRLRRRFLREHIRVGEHREQNGQWQESVNCYESGLRVDACAEDVCRCLMSAYNHLGRPTEVLAVYRRCREALANQLGVNPSAETESLLKRLR